VGIEDEDIFYAVGIEGKENFPLLSTRNQSAHSQTKKLVG
jgi:hypothetical protein